jgi:hypothetical protein
MATDVEVGYNGSLNTSSSPYAPHGPKVGPEYISPQHSSIDNIVENRPADQAPDHFVAPQLGGDYSVPVPYDLSNILQEIDYSGMGRVLEWVSKTDGKWTQNITSVIEIGGKTKVQKFNAVREFVRKHEGKHNDPETLHEEDRQLEEERANRP